MALPPVVAQDVWRKELQELRTREKGATKELDAIAAPGGCRWWSCPTTS